MRIRRVWKAGLLVAVGAAGGGAALAVASVPDSNGVIHACLSLTTNGSGATVPNQFGSAPDITVIDPSAGQSCIPPDPPAPNQMEISWNQVGPPGPRGPQGKSVTVAGGNTLTLAGGGVVTVGSSKAVTINTPTLTPHSNAIGTVKLQLGGSSLTFDLYSWSFPGGTHPSGGGGATGRAEIKEIEVTKRVDKASAKLVSFCATGKHIPSATITLRKAGNGQQKYLQIKLETVLVSSYQTSSQSDTPTESVSLNFSKIKFDYTPQKK